MNTKQLQIAVLDQKIQDIKFLNHFFLPSKGWIRSIRKTLGMSQLQLAKRLSITNQSVHEIEKREEEGTITLRTLEETANSLDMKLVYGLVPKDGSLESLINRKAFELAEKIVLRASQTMKLEDQEVPEERIKKAIQERAESFKNQLPKILWD